MQMELRYFFVSFILICGLPFNIFSQQSAIEIKQLSKDADVILTGKVSRQTSSWNENKTRIYTNATIQVEEYIKGNNNVNTVTVTYPGGEVGDVGELYSHMPKFDSNEEVLVFLKKETNSSNYKVLNGEEGKITVITDQSSGEKITTSNLKINSLKAQIKSYIND